MDHGSFSTMYVVSFAEEDLIVFAVSVVFEYEFKHLFDCSFVLRVF